MEWRSSARRPAEQLQRVRGGRRRGLVTDARNLLPDVSPGGGAALDLGGAPAAVLRAGARTVATVPGRGWNTQNAHLPLPDAVLLFLFAAAARFHQPRATLQSTWLADHTTRHTGARLVQPAASACQTVAVAVKHSYFEPTGRGHCTASPRRSWPRVGDSAGAVMTCWRCRVRVFVPVSIAIPGPCLLTSWRYAFGNAGPASPAPITPRSQSSVSLGELPPGAFIAGLCVMPVAAQGAGKADRPWRHARGNLAPCCMRGPILPGRTCRLCLA